jgi:hypothetical protein
MITCDKFPFLEVITVNKYQSMKTIVDLVVAKFETMTYNCYKRLPPEELDNYTKMNPYVMIGGPIKPKIAIDYIVRDNDKVSWFTYDSKTSKYVYAETRVSRAITTLHKINGKTKIITTMIVIITSDDIDLLVSGTFFQVEKRVFIGVGIHRIPGTQTFAIFASCPIPHNFKCQLKII